MKNKELGGYMLYFIGAILYAAIMLVINVIIGNVTNNFDLYFAIYMISCLIFEIMSCIFDINNSLRRISDKLDKSTEPKDINLPPFTGVYSEEDPVIDAQYTVIKKESAQRKAEHEAE